MGRKLYETLPLGIAGCLIVSSCEPYVLAVVLIYVCRHAYSRDTGRSSTKPCCVLQAVVRKQAQH